MFNQNKLYLLSSKRLYNKLFFFFFFFPFNSIEWYFSALSQSLVVLNDRNWNWKAKGINTHQFSRLSERTMIRVQNNLIRFSVHYVHHYVLPHSIRAICSAQLSQWGPASHSSSALSPTISTFSNFTSPLTRASSPPIRMRHPFLLRDAAHRETVVGENCELSLRPAESWNFYGTCNSRAVCQIGRDGFFFWTCRWIFSFSFFLFFFPFFFEKKLISKSVVWTGFGNREIKLISNNL